jgi:hypothetical protein
MHSLDAGDRDKHSMAVAKFHCTWTKPFEMGGTQTKESSIVEFEDTTGAVTSGRGVHWGTMANGDKYSVRYQGTFTAKDGGPPDHLRHLELHRRHRQSQRPHREGHL